MNRKHQQRFRRKGGGGALMRPCNSEGDAALVWWAEDLGWTRSPPGLWSFCLFLRVTVVCMVRSLEHTIVSSQNVLFTSVSANCCFYWQGSSVDVCCRCEEPFSYANLRCSLMFAPCSSPVNQTRYQANGTSDL